MKRSLRHQITVMVGLVAVVAGTAGAASGSGAYSIRVEFTNADGLVKGNDVLIYGVKAGQVRDLEVQGSLAEVRISIDPRFAPLHGGTRAIVRSLGLLGNHYVEVVPGPAGGSELADNDVLTVASTTSPTDLDQFNAIFDAPTRQKLKAATLQGQIALGTRAQVLNQDLYQLRNLAVAAAPLTGVLDDHQVALDRATVAFDNLTQKLTREDAALGGFISHGASLLDSVQQHDVQLGGLLSHADTSLGKLDAVLNGNEDNLANFLARQPQALADTEYNVTSALPVVSATRPLMPDLLNLVYYMQDATTSRDGAGNPDDPNSGTQYMLRVLATPCDQVAPGGTC
ncbi:MAG: MlaD family protein [Candidatus Dormibacteria bacterium]